MSLFKILRFFVPGAQGHFRIFFAAVGVTFCLGPLGRCSCFGRAFSLAGAGVFTYASTLNSIVLVFLAPGGEKLPPQLR